MSDTYQAIYDAIRSRISGGNISEAVADIARNSFDISRLLEAASQELYSVSYEWRRPFMLLKPRMFPDGNQWCALYGDDIQSGVCGFGDTPDRAAAEFDKAWWNDKAPPAAKEGKA